MFYQKIFLSLALSVVLPWQISSATSDQSVNNNYLSAKRPAPPPRIPPNKVKPGGGLDLAQQACSSEQSLVALIPVDNPVLTTQSYPSFLFYIPDNPTAIDYGEFSLFTPDEKTRVYSTNIDFESTPGIIKIDLPTSPQYALQEAKPYHWYFKIYCSKELDSPVSIDVNGWIKRVAMTPNRASQIEAASPDVWYDAIALAAKDIIAAPHDSSARDRWLKLLQHINREYLLNVGISSVTTTTNEVSQQN